MFALALLCASCFNKKEIVIPPKPLLTPASLAKEAPDPERLVNPTSILLHGATIMDANGNVFSPGFIHFSNGTIEAVGPGVPENIPQGTAVLNISGKYVTPGLIDTHSHMGVYAIPHVSAHSDGNEATHPVTSEVWAEHSFWPQDPAIFRALGGGITTIQVLPGSANLIGGRSYIAHLQPKVSAREMRFPGAPQGLKMACGENPKRVYRGKGRAPSTRMGNIAQMRATFQKAHEYMRRWETYERDLKYWQSTNHLDPAKAEDPPSLPERNLAMETLAKVLKGEILVHNHCYRADEMHLMLDLAQEFGFKIRSFHHALEAYKLAPRLAQEGVASSTWADWWGFKMEAFDGIPQNAGLLSRAGARAIIHSDSNNDIRYLNQEAAKARAAAAKVGIAIDDNEVLRWITANPAWALGIEDKVGTLEAGKWADLVIWDKNPFSVYAQAQQVLINGMLVYEKDSKTNSVSDFEVDLN
tara:strand:- start:468 stop:1880 length:1413 start_codon:yes stop_codon:yes gene_type:complete